MKETKEEKEPNKKRDRRKLAVILLGGLAGVLLLLAGSGWFSSPKTKTTAEVRSAEEELETYRAAVEARIASLCASVAGVGDVKVAVTLSGGVETVYATEIRNGSEVYATVGSGSGATALVVSRDPPTVVGIGVVCRGGGNSEVRNELTALLSSAFRVPTNRIRVTEGKSG